MIKIATWDYDRVRPLIDGRVKIKGEKIDYAIESMNFWNQKMKQAVESRKKSRKH